MWLRSCFLYLRRSKYKLLIIYFICMKLNWRRRSWLTIWFHTNEIYWSITNSQVALLSNWLIAMDGWKEPYKSDRKLGLLRVFWLTVVRTCVFSCIASFLFFPWTSFRKIVCGHAHWSGRFNNGCLLPARWLGGILQTIHLPRYW